MLFTVTIIKFASNVVDDDMAAQFITPTGNRSKLQDFFQ